MNSRQFNALYNRIFQYEKLIESFGLNSETKSLENTSRITEGECLTLLEMLGDIEALLFIIQKNIASFKK